MTLLLLALLLGELGRQLGSEGLDAASLLGSLEPAWLLAGAASYVLVNLLRAARFSVLLSQPGLGTRALLPIGFALSLLNNLLPLRGGEVAFVLMMRSGYQVSGARGTATIGLARMLDYLAVALCFLPLALISMDDLPRRVDWPVAGLRTAWLIGLVLLAILLGSLVILSLASLGRRALALISQLLARLGLGHRALAVRIMGFAVRMVEAFDAMRDRQRLPRAFGLSILVWLSIFGWQYCMARGLGLSAGPGQPDFASIGLPLFVVAATLGVLSNAVPLPTMGGHGVIEAGWALGFALVGLPPALALGGSLGIALLTLVYSSLAGGAALLLLRRRARAAAAA